MSLKYQRVKQADLDLPAPIRWITRAFSSITLAVVLLTLISVYGLVASVPVGMLVRGGLAIFVALAALAPLLILAYVFARPGGDFSKKMSLPVRATIALILIAIGANLAWLFGFNALHWAGQQPWVQLHQATVIYRLPHFEMTELEFYSWWPFKALLLLFVFNMFWATVRRIEFKFVNIGVLTVHAGIITIAAGSMIYGNAKLEGDTILWREDIGGRAVDHFYDATEPAIYVRRGAGQMMIPLPVLPRYNDYLDRDLPRPIVLHELKGWDQVVGPNVRATISNFVGYGQLESYWTEADPVQQKVLFQNGGHNHAITLTAGPANTPIQELTTLVTAVPNLRVLDTPQWAVEYLARVSPQRLADLKEPFAGTHGLLIEVPGTDFRTVIEAEPGKQFTYEIQSESGTKKLTLDIKEVGPYGLPFITPGYQDAQDTRVVVAVTYDNADPSLHGDGPRTFNRIVMHRYPERSQEFVPSDAPGTPPIGKRQDPSPDLRLVYLDQSKPWFRLIDHHQPDRPLDLLVRLPKNNPIAAPLTEPKFPIGRTAAGATWLHITQRFTNAIELERPVLTPKAQRQPKDEGTYLNAIVPIDLEIDTEHGVWNHTVWLTHMRYPLFPDEVKRPKRIDIPDGRALEFTFSRTRHPLPFSAKLKSFAMTPYPGSDIPRDFESQLEVVDVNQAGQIIGQPEIINTHLNNPAKHRGFKISQTGWDPGEATDETLKAKDAEGRFVNQQRFSILGIGNNKGIQIIALGAVMVSVGIPWAFYIKPWLVRRQSQKLRKQAVKKSDPKPETEAETQAETQAETTTPQTEPVTA